MNGNDYYIDEKKIGIKYLIMRWMPPVFLNDKHIWQ